MKHNIYLVSGPNFHGEGKNRVQLTEYALSTAGAQFRQVLKDDLCSALTRCGDERDALPAMGYTEHGIHALTPHTVVTKLSGPCVAMHGRCRARRHPPCCARMVRGFAE